MPGEIDWSSIRRVALLRRGRLGDLLCAMPLLAAIKERAPGSHVTVVGDRMQQQLVPYLPQIDAFISLGEGERNYLRALQHGWRHRGQFDLAISAKTSPKSWNNLFMAVLNAPYRLGFSGGKAFERWLTHPMAWTPFYAHNHHQALKSLHLIDPTLQAVPSHLQPRLDLTPDRATWSTWLSQQITFGSGPLLTLSVTNNRPTSFLGVDKSIRLLNSWYQHHPFRVAIAAMPSDLPVAQRIAAHLAMPARVVETSALAATLYLVEASDLVVVGDGGVSHMAAALDRPQLCLFGETSPIEWAPLSEKATVLFHRQAVDQLSDEELLAGLATAFGGATAGR
jgi:ADP-heptose:LPS heptosyltransferase